MSNKYEKIYAKVRKSGSRANWVDTAVMSLAVDIEEKTGLPVKVSGPYGLRASVCLDVGYSPNDMKTITLSPIFSMDTEDDFFLYYDTGMNNETARLPESLDAIIELLQDVYPKIIRGVLFQPFCGASEYEVTKKNLSSEVSIGIHANALQVTSEAEYSIFYDESKWGDKDARDLFNKLKNHERILPDAPSIFVCRTAGSEWASLNPGEFGDILF